MITRAQAYMYWASSGTPVDYADESATAYHLFAQFKDADAAPITSPYDADVGDLTFVQTDGTQAASAGKLAFAAQTTPSWGDQGFYGDAIARKAGQMLIVDFNISTWEECGFGWHAAAAVVDPDSMEHAIQLNTTDGTLDNEDGTTIYTGLSTGTDYKLASGLRAAGAWYYLHDGTQWMLIWITDSGTTATLYPAFSNLDGAGSIDNFRVPSFLYIPTMARYDTFTRANSTDLGTTETTGPDGQSVTASAWAENEGDWRVISNAVNTTTDTGSRMNITTDAGTANQFLEATIKTDGGTIASLLGRYGSSGADGWDLGLAVAANLVILYEVNSGSRTSRATKSVSISADTTYNMKMRMIGNEIMYWMDQTNQHVYASATAHAAQTEVGTLHYKAVDERTYDIAAWYSIPPDFPQV